MKSPSNEKSSFQTKKNKGAFVKLLGDRLTNAGCIVLHAEEDADTLIAKTAIEYAKTQNVTLMSDDTDILCLLIHHFQRDNSFKLILKNHSKSNKPSKAFDINQLAHTIPNDVKENILFCHAMTGCDTTSRVHGV